MKVPDFIKWAESVQKEENRIMLTKGQEYTVSDEDKFKNFKSIAERIKIEPQKVTLIYLLKHMESIRNYVLSGVESSDDGTNITSTTSSKITESNTEHCSNKPRIEHVLKDVGVVSECRDYYTSYRIKGRVRHVKGLLCKNGNGDWEAVDQRYSYFN